MALPATKPNSSVQLSIPTLGDWLRKYEKEIALALPRHISKDKFLRVVQTAIRRTPKLIECEPLSLAAAIFVSAQLGLIPDGVTGEAYLIPRRNKKTGRHEVNFQPGYKGLINLARRSGEISYIDADIVYEEEIKQGRFKFAKGEKRELTHEPILNGPRGKMAAVYAISKLKDGEVAFAVLGEDDVLKIKNSSEGADSEYSPWKTWPEWMWKKSALIQLCKLLPRDTENAKRLAKAVDLDEMAKAGIPQGNEFENESFAGELLPITDDTPKEMENDAQEPAPKDELFDKKKG